MTTRLTPHRARYSILGRGGAVAGEEELVVEPDGDGTRVRSRLASGYPVSVTAEVDWRLLPDLGTRLLEIHSRVAGEVDCSIELAVTGNGLLAHRTGADGPTQVELGWGPAAALDYISAAFPAVMVARAALLAGESSRIDVVQIATEDLVPSVLVRELTAVGDDPAGRGFETRVAETGHRAAISVDPSGALIDYEGVLRLDSLSLLPAPTK